MTSRYVVFLMVLNYFREICLSYKAEFLCRPYSSTGISINMKIVSEEVGGERCKIALVLVGIEEIRLLQRFQWTGL